MLKQFEELSRTVRNLSSVTDLLKSMGEKTDNVFDIEDNFRGSEQMKVCVDRVKAIPEARAMMDDRYMGSAIDLEALSKLPKGTLGHTYATVMKTLGYDPNFFRQREIETDDDWVVVRLRKTHDLTHLITGFGPAGGELGVLSINAVQIGYPASVVLQVASIGLALKRQPEKLSYVTQQAARGMGMALEIKPLIAQRWEEGWDKPLQQWREELNITDPVIDEPYSMKNRLPDLDLDW
ncbi:pyrroloquinoline quinone biosynthesis protein (plasmid) [Phormidium sp. CLA17]|uniref:Coq4 family protein n=1 Tax=Leptolyngbya sp. Cla-17 TaxID=2803751 RepID=UPI0014931301|nr:Coq4 family protein [Leptolyngbya sp. Cla-17]MBM0745093.1 pyrroloquinoline quinone biosynthesis protein [Leptolyngbya sp. Cla-17]